MGGGGYTGGYTGGYAGLGRSSGSKATSGVFLVDTIKLWSNKK